MARWISGVGDVKTLGQGELLVCFSGDLRGSSEVSVSEMSALAPTLAPCLRLFSLKAPTQDSGADSVCLPGAL